MDAFKKTEELVERLEALDKHLGFLLDRTEYSREDEFVDPLVNGLIESAAKAIHVLVERMVTE